MSDIYHAHSGNGPNRDQRYETVFEHVDAVTKRARLYASAFHAQEQAGVAALLHDLGKYSSQFQKRLTDRREPSRDHWTLGAWALLGQQKPSSVLPALAILGHHLGLPALDGCKSLSNRLGAILSANPERFTTSSVHEHQLAMKRFLADGFEMPKLTIDGLVPRHAQAADMLDTRMLFSTLVDADFVETEAHFEGDARTPRRPRAEGLPLCIDAMIEAFDNYMARFDSGSRSMIDILREKLSQRCQAVGTQQAMGAFTLCAPTGFGKTLAMLRFALHHAQTHQARRIVLVMPFLNIIDQTALIYREIFPASQFGEDFLLEAHSAAGREVEMNDQDVSTVGEIRRRLMSQNWDAPVVLTTNVQLLESLHAHKPSSCRKLHRLAGSVILFDEVQTLPPKLAVATLATLSRLCDPAGPYRTSILFATATQPAFESLSSRVSRIVDSKVFRGIPPKWQPLEINDAQSEMFEIAARRVRVQWEQEHRLKINEMADRLDQHDQVLCIVNLKRHATELALMLAERSDDVLHLSTNMTLLHRTKVLRQVRDRLIAKKPIRLIATQCVEAGVDLDFPVVMRALAPLEAIAQAAGRCNRNGRRPICDLTVFALDDPDEEGRQRRPYPPGYDAAVSATRLFLKTINADSDAPPEIINDPKRMQEYFEMLYTLNGRDRQQQDDEAELLQAIQAGDFAETDKQYRLIDQNMIQIVLPYDLETSLRLIDDATESAAENGGMTPKQIRRWQRLAAPHAVAIYRPRDNDEIFSRLLPIHFGSGIKESSSASHDSSVATSQIEWWYPADSDCYDELIGMRLAETNWVM